MSPAASSSTASTSTNPRINNSTSTAPPPMANSSPSSSSINTKISSMGSSTYQQQADASQDRAAASNSNTPYYSIHCNKSYLKNLKEYRATSVDYSLTRTYLLKPYLYENLIRFIPHQMHPNLVTLSGLLFIIAQVLITVYYSDNMTNSQTESWVFVFSALCLFIYQTLDNLDGMQARRTGSSSALDALVTCLAACAWMSVCARGVSTYGFLASMCPAFPFIAATWQEYYDHSLVFGYVNGPNEGLLMVMGGLLLTGLLGHETIHFPVWKLMQHFGMSSLLSIFEEKLSSIGLAWILQHSLVHLSNCVVFCTALLTIGNHMICVFKHKPSRFLCRLKTLIPHVLELVCTYIWLASCEGSTALDEAEGDMSASGIPARYPLLFWLNHTFLFAFLASQVTLAFVMKAPLAEFFWSLVPYIIGSLNAYFHFITFVSEDILFFAIFAWSVVNYAVFVLDVSWNVASALDIGILKLNDRQVKRMRELQREEKQKAA